MWNEWKFGSFECEMKETRIKNRELSMNIKIYMYVSL